LPILDNDVNDFLKPPRELFWVTLHDELSDSTRREAIADVCRVAPAHVSLLRRIDVALWRAAQRR
jgi:hypothetical protein